MILLDDVPGFVGEQAADTVIACRPDGTCVTENGNLLAGFRPEVWPNLRVVDDDPVIEEDVQVVATAFGRILLREGTNGESFVSTAGKPVVVTFSEESFETTSARVPSPDAVWARNNFTGPGAFWITYDGGEGAETTPANGTAMTVREDFTVPVGATGDLDGLVLADDTARVVLIQGGTPVVPPIFEYNSEQDRCADGIIGCEVGEEGDLSLGDAAWQSDDPPLDLNALPPGAYALEFTARQDRGGPFGLQYAVEVGFAPSTVADVCWTFDGGTPGEKVCVSIAECEDCDSPPAQCPTAGEAKIALTSGPDGDEICTDVAEQFFEKGATTIVEEFQFVVGLNVPDTAKPGSVRIATCIVAEAPEEEDTYVPLCRDPASSVLNATVHNDVPIFAFETPRCVKLGGRTLC